MRRSASRALGAITVLVMAAFFFVLATPEPAFSRAGGGHSYSSGSHSSSSSSKKRSSGWSSKKSSSSSHSRSRSRGSGSSTPMNSSEATFFFLVMVIGGFVVAVKIYADYVNKSPVGTEWTDVEKVQRQFSKLRTQPDSVREKALEALKLRDPNWNEMRFLERAKQGFSRIQDAWSKQNLSPAQGFLSDGVYERFSIQIDEQKSDGIRDHMENLRILNARIVQAESGSRFDVLHLSIRASAVNYRVSLAGGRRLDGSTEPEEFEEIWSFLRRPGSKTLEKPGLIEGVCPSCGAPLEIVRAAKCAYCQTFLRSGEHDWVLAEITQACEWSVADAKPRPGLDRLMEADPGFSVQQIEDRASVMFWRYYTAFRLGKVDPMLKHAHPDFIAKLRAKLAPKPSGSRTIYQTAAVGSVNVLGAAPGESTTPSDSFDRIPVELRWSWKSVEKNAKGSVIPGAEHPLNCTQIFVLIRRSGVKTDIGLALSGSCCKNCGAPETDTTGTVCQYCQTPLNEGTTDWILEQITDPHAPDVARLLKSQPAAPRPESDPRTADNVSVGNTSGNTFELHGSADALRWMASVIFADRKVEQAELDLLKQYARTYGVPQAKFNEIVLAAKAGKAIPQPPANPQEVAAMYRELVRFALADGTMSDAEQQLLNAFCRQGNLPADEAARILASVKSTRV